jgi:hypothetical protein
LALQMMIVDGPVAALFGVHETEVFEAFVDTVKMKIPTDGEFLESPP